jgi:NitT/TauT family transport system substrate-binding protein
VAGLVRALNRALIETAADPDAATALMLKKEPLLNAVLEKQRLLYAVKTHFISPETDEIGVGDVKDERRQKAIDVIAQTYDLPKAPAVSDVFDHGFLPPKDARMLKARM